jgi:hypothetical protein
VRRNEASYGLSRPNKRSRKYKSASSKDEFLEGLEEILAEEKTDATSKRREEGELQKKDSVFEFDPDKENNGLPPSKMIRVGDSLKRKKEDHGDAIFFFSDKEDSFAMEKGKFTLDESLPIMLDEGNYEYPTVCKLGLAECTSGPVEDMVRMQEEEAVPNEPNLGMGREPGIAGIAAESTMAPPTAAPPTAAPPTAAPPTAAPPTAAPTANEPNTNILNDFKAYIERAKKDFCRLSTDMKASIELMSLMNEKGGSVALFDAVLDWHMAHLQQEKVIHSSKLHCELIDRYHLGPTLPIERSFTLPHSKEHVNLACHDAKAQLVDLLTDPRLCDDDYLFFEDDPMAGIPEEFETVGDVNTSLSYRETYKAIIAPEPIAPSGRRKILCPFIFYVDGCVVGQFQGQNIEIFKFTVGLFRNKTRTYDWAWRPLGYVAKRCKRNKKAEENIKASTHKDGKTFVREATHRAMQYPSAADGSGPQFDWKIYAKDNRQRKQKKKRPPRVHAQDFHSMLQVILQSYKRIEEEGGIEWDLRYHGRTFPVVLIPFIIFLKVDSVEADKVCGTHGSKTSGVQSICRYCCIPTDETDNPFYSPTPQRKTQDLISDLVSKATHAKDKAEKEEAMGRLQAVSQHCIWNTFHQFRFGQHDRSGIHGATPWETLHWIQLGFYKYDREALFLQTGKTTILSRNLDALAQTFGHFLDRQSDRSLPRVAFNDGIREGRMQGHEMVGVILLLVLAMRSRAGRDLLLDTARGDQKSYFDHEDRIKDWIQMLESHLMFEQWLRKEQFDVHVLERAKTRLKHFMQFTKDVGAREEKMGYKTANFHATLHMPEIAQNLGAFVGFNTDCNESHHKKDKKSARRTNMQLESFDISHANKVVQRHAIELAMEELDGTIRRWDYYHRGVDAHAPQGSFFLPQLKGPRVEFFYDDDEEKIDYKIKSKMVGKERCVYDENTLAFILSLGNDVREHDNISSFQAYGTLDIYSPTRQNCTQHFYAKPYLGGKPWNDWAIFDLSDPEDVDPQARRRVPAQIKCFLDFSHLPPQNSLMKPPGVYAIVEPTFPNAAHDEKWWSRLFDPCCKAPCIIHGFFDFNHQELVSIDKIVDTAAVVPDHENPNARAFLRMVPMSLWADMFENWIMLDDENDD